MEEIDNFFFDRRKSHKAFGERAFAKFHDKNSNIRYPKILDDSENISGRVRVLLKIIGWGRVSGTRLTLSTAAFLLLRPDRACIDGGSTE